MFEIPDLKKQVCEALKANRNIKNFIVKHDFRQMGEMKLKLNITPVQQSNLKKLILTVEA